MKTTPKAVLPGSTIGILGGGQLGRMTGLEAKKMGYRIHIYDPMPDGPASQIADHETVAPFNDEKALRSFANQVDVITYEFENIDTTSLKSLKLDLFPSIHILETTQHRLKEKNFLSSIGVPVAPYCEVKALDDLFDFLNHHQKAILKTSMFGYDGKGQSEVTAHNAKSVWDQFHGSPCIVEAKIPFDFEASCIFARNALGEVKTFPISQNIHQNHILDVTLVPAKLDDRLRNKIFSIAESIASHIDLMGLMCVELFIVGDTVFVNELAPRPHNSGHYSLDYCVTSQFEQHVRSICNLPLGDTSLMVPAAGMANLLGDIWISCSPKQPSWGRALAQGVSLHLYGKQEAKPGRKMGHLTAWASSIEDVKELIEKARKKLSD